MLTWLTSIDECHSFCQCVQITIAFSSWSYLQLWVLFGVVGGKSVCSWRIHTGARTLMWHSHRSWEVDLREGCPQVGLWSRSRHLISAGEAIISVLVSRGEQLGLISVLSFNVLCPCLPKLMFGGRSFGSCSSASIPRIVQISDENCYRMKRNCLAHVSPQTSQQGFISEGLLFCSRSRVELSFLAMLLIHCDNYTTEILLLWSLLYHIFMTFLIW